MSRRNGVLHLVRVMQRRGLQEEHLPVAVALVTEMDERHRAELLALDGGRNAHKMVAGSTKRGGDRDNGPAP